MFSDAWLLLYRACSTCSIYRQWTVTAVEARGWSLSSAKPRPRGDLQSRSFLRNASRRSRMLLRLRALGFSALSQSKQSSKKVTPSRYAISTAAYRPQSTMHSADSAQRLALALPREAKRPGKTKSARGCKNCTGMLLRSVRITFLCCSWRSCLSRRLTVASRPRP